MIVMSGYYTNTSRPACDAPTIGGQHGLALGPEGKERGQPWLGLMTNVTEYRVPDNITDIIGGGCVVQSVLSTVFTDIFVGRTGTQH